MAWSPQQIAQRLRLDYTGDLTMHISHEAIYQTLYVQGRWALRRELNAFLRMGRTLRVSRSLSRGRGKAFVTREVLISNRPAEAADRAVPEHWEGDLILGLRSLAIGTWGAQNAVPPAIDGGHGLGGARRTGRRWLSTMPRRYAGRSR